jgi:hypothetical protein
MTQTPNSNRVQPFGYLGPWVLWHFVSALHQLFRNLHRVERRAFEQLIAAHPEAQTDLASRQNAIYASPRKGEKKAKCQ